MDLPLLNRCFLIYLPQTKWRIIRMLDIRRGTDTGNGRKTFCCRIHFQVHEQGLSVLHIYHWRSQCYVTNVARKFLFII